MSMSKLDEEKKKAIQKQIKKLSKKVNIKAKPSESQFSIALRRFRKNPIGIIGLGVIIVLFFLGVFASPIEVNVAFRNEQIYLPTDDTHKSTYTWGGLTPYDPAEPFSISIYNSSDKTARQTLYKPGYKAPGSYDGWKQLKNGSVIPVTMNHFFGTNNEAQDLFSRLILGARISIFVSVGAVLIALMIGLPVGLLAGYYGGRVDELLMRITDLFLNLPFYLLILMAIKLFNENRELDKFLTNLDLQGEVFIFAIVIGLGIFGWTGIARLIRAQIFQIKSMDYVEAARALGASPNRIMIRHILPNVLVALIVVISIAMGGNIVVEAAISFLLFNTQETASWGVEISKGLNQMSQAWWPVLFPGLFITVAVLGFNLLGDAINDAFDPRAN